MRRRRLWCAVLLSGLGALLFTTTTVTMTAAKSILDPRTLLSAAQRWEHVNRTCRARDCDDIINYEQLRSIESYMNRSANPCESFYAYACGNWKRENPRGTTTMMMKGKHQLIARQMQIFESWLSDEIEFIGLNEGRLLAGKREATTGWRPHEDRVLQKMLKYYKICKRQNSMGSPTLRAYFEASKSTVTGNWQLDDEYDWMLTLAGIGRYGYSAHFLGMNVVEKNLSTHRIVFCPHSLESPLKIDSEIFDVLRDFTNSSQAALQHSFDKLETDLEQLYCHYCKHHSSESSDECDCYHSVTMTLGNLISQLPDFDWRRFLNSQLGRQIGDDEIIEIADIDLIRLQLDYVRDEIDKELNFLYTLARFLNYIREQRSHLEEYTTGAVELNCIHHMRKLFNLPMNYVYERAYYSSKREHSQPIIEKIFDELKVQFEKMTLQNNMKFVNAIQRKLLSKLQRIDINIGNLPKNITTQFYYDYVEAYDFGDNFARNHMHGLEVFYKHYNSLMDIDEQEIQYKWHSFNLHEPSYPDTLDASPYYNARSNLIVITFPYLQLPFFDASFWPAFIYADLASTLGHEMLHAFDTEFLKFNENGNPDVEPLTSMFLNEHFQRNVECLQRGTAFERERMADVSGAQLALNTFLNLDSNALKRNGELYFLQFSQFFCGDIDNDDVKHDSGSSRLDYVLGALPEFSKVFSCPLGSPMNPHERCQLYV